MVFSAKFSSKNSINEGWGMGFLLILFHHHHPDDNLKKPSSYSLSSSKSNNNLLFSKTQYTLSVCGILVFTTLILFTLSTFEPTSVLHHHHPPRRILKQTKILRNGYRRLSVSNLFSPRSKGSESNFTHIAKPALQGMGTLFLRGSKAMTDLIVGHVNEDTSEIELRSFLRVIYCSEILSRTDFVLIFPSPLLASRFGPVVKSECDSFVRLVQLGKFTEFDSGLSRYLREVGAGEKEPMWGRKMSNLSELTGSSFGSVVGFEASELDPEDSLSGFLDHVPMSLRRWASYPMLLGRVRRQFKHMMLVDVKTTLILSDPFFWVRNRSSESLFLYLSPEAELILLHRRRNSGKNRDSDPKTQVHPGIIVGGSRGVRRFTAAALTEIVRNVIEHKGKGRNSVTVTESGLVNQLVRSGHLLKHINLITPRTRIPELSSLKYFNSSSSYYRLSNGGQSVDISNSIMKQICGSQILYSSDYSEDLVVGRE